MVGAHFDVRLALPAEADLVRRLSAEAYGPAYSALPGDAPLPAREDYRPRIERGEVWILEVGRAPCGVLVLLTRADHLLVYSVAVTPSLQGQGYGAGLLSFAEGRACSLWLPAVRLYTNARMARNLAFYERCGFVRVGARPHPTRPGETLIDLEKRLS